jgi:chemotaxis protein MotA
MDISTVAGLVFAMGLVLWAVMSGSGLAIFIDVPSVLIVGGGAIGAALTAFPLRHALRVARVTKNCFFTRPADPAKLIQELVAYAEIARRDGILALESRAKEVKDPFLVTGLQMAVDGSPPELIEQILNSELDAVAERHEEGKALFDAIGKYAPAYGMIGTLVGLVQMLKNMSDPSQIGAGMAVALLTTLYGSLAANLFALPLADKLALRSAEELRLKSIVVRGVIAIQSGDNPRVVEQKLRTVLPHSKRNMGGVLAQAA